MNFSLKASMAPSETESFVIAIACHMLIEQIPLDGRLDALQALLDVHEFTVESIRPLQPAPLPPTSPIMTGTLASISERSIPTPDAEE